MHFLLGIAKIRPPLLKLAMWSFFLLFTLNIKNEKWVAPVPHPTPTHPLGAMPERNAFQEEFPRQDLKDLLLWTSHADKQGVEAAINIEIITFVVNVIARFSFFVIFALIVGNL